MVYVEQVGIKRQEGGRIGEMRYLYPFTHPMNTFSGNLLIFISCALTASKSGCKEFYSFADITGMLTRKIRAYSKNDIAPSRVQFPFKPE